MLEAQQQQQLSGMQEQLLQLKDLHKKKLTRYKVQLQQQYESHLAAATSAYIQELSLVHMSNDCGRLLTVLQSTYAWVPWSQQTAVIMHWLWFAPS